jgi:hypothetical protein
MLPGPSRGHIHEKPLSGPLGGANVAVDGRHCDAVHGRGWRDVLSLPVPTLIVCRKTAMRPFLIENKMSTMAEASWLGGAVFFLQPMASALLMSCYLIRLGSSYTGTVLTLQHRQSVANLLSLTFDLSVGL